MVHHEHHVHHGARLLLPPGAHPHLLTLLPPWCDHQGMGGRQAGGAGGGGRVHHGGVEEGAEHGVRRGEAGGGVHGGVGLHGEARGVHGERGEGAGDGARPLQGAFVTGTHGRHLWSAGSVSR